MSGTVLGQEAIASSLKPHLQRLKKVLAEGDFSIDKVERTLALVPECQLRTALGRINIQEVRPSVAIGDSESIEALIEEESRLAKELEDLDNHLKSLEDESRQETDFLFKELASYQKEASETNKSKEKIRLMREEITSLEKEYQHSIKSVLPRLESISILDHHFQISFDSQTGIGFLSNTPFGRSPVQTNNIDWDQTNICFSHVCYLLSYVTQTHQIRSADYTIAVCDFPPSLQFKNLERCRLQGPSPSNNSSQLGVALCMLLAVVDEAAKNLMKKVQVIQKTKPESGGSSDQKALFETIQKTISKLALDVNLVLPFEISGKSIIRNKVSAQGMLGSVTNMFKKDKTDDSAAEISNFSNVAEWTTTLACFLVDLKYIILLSDVLHGYHVPMERLTQLEEMKTRIITKFTKDR